MQKEWSNGVSGNRKNFGAKIKSHEKTQSHLDARIAFGRLKAGQRIDRVQEQAIATEATFWRKCLLRIINIIMTLAMMSLALRGHREQRERERERERESMVRCQLITSVNTVNDNITQHAISFTLFGTLIIFGTPLYEL